MGRQDNPPGATPLHHAAGLSLCVCACLGSSFAFAVGDLVLVASARALLWLWGGMILTHTEGPLCTGEGKRFFLCEGKCFYSFFFALEQGSVNYSGRTGWWKEALLPPGFYVLYLASRMPRPLLPCTLSALPLLIFLGRLPVFWRLCLSFGGFGRIFLALFIFFGAFICIFGAFSCILALLFKGLGLLFVFWRFYLYFGAILWILAPFLQFWRLFFYFGAFFEILEPFLIFWCVYFLFWQLLSYCCVFSSILQPFLIYRRLFYVLVRLPMFWRVYFYILPVLFTFLAPLFAYWRPSKIITFARYKRKKKHSAIFTVYENCKAIRENVWSIG